MSAVCESVPRLDIEQRVNITLAVGRFVRTRERHAEAANESYEAGKQLKALLPKGTRFITQIDHVWYLVTVDASGIYEVEQVEQV